MKGKKYNVEKQLVMISDPILGVKYELQNVLIEQEIPLALRGGEAMMYEASTIIKLEKKCRHPKSARQEIGNRILCSVCNQYMKTSNKTA